MARLSTPIAVLLALAMLSSARAAEWGNLSGRFVYDGKPPAAKTIEPDKDQDVCGKHKIPDERRGMVLVDKDRGIANVVVMLKTANPAVAPQYQSSATEQVILDNKNCRFEPHVVVVRLTQTLALHNSDPIPHNSKLNPLKTQNPGINPILPAGGDPVEYRFKAEEGLPVQVGCNIHQWMSAWVVVRNDPYAAVSGPDGKFTIKDLPAGDLDFTLWQESSGYLKGAAFKGGKADARGRFKFKVKPGENDLGDIKVSPSIFKK